MDTFSSDYDGLDDFSLGRKYKFSSKNFRKKN